VEKAPSNLEELISPVTEEEFFVILRERRLTLLRGTDRDRYQALLNWDVLRRMIEIGEYPHTEFRVAKGSEHVPALFYLKDGKVNIINLEMWMAKGYSIIFTRVEPYVPALTVLCDNIKSRLQEKIVAGVIVTSTGEEGALELHHDPEDLIILQLEGSKRWRLYGPPVSNPVDGMPKQSAPQGGCFFDEVLHPGDLLFVPGGSWHHCNKGPGRSLHIGIFLIPPTGWHFLKGITSQLLSEEMFRVPITRLDDTSELPTCEAKLKSRLIEKIKQRSFNEFIAEWQELPHQRK